MNPWFKHLSEVRKANPNIKDVGEIAKLAKKTYKKQKGGEVEPANANNHQENLIKEHSGGKKSRKVRKSKKVHKSKKAHKSKKSKKAHKSRKVNKSRKSKKGGGCGCNSAMI